MLKSRPGPRRLRAPLHPTPCCTRPPAPHKQIHFGQEVLLVGSHAALGAWQLDGAVRAAWSEGDVWSASVDLPAGAELEFKFVVADPSRWATWVLAGGRWVLAGRPAGDCGDRVRPPTAADSCAQPLRAR